MIGFAFQALVWLLAGAAPPGEAGRAAGEAAARPQSGVASYYAPAPGETTASGEPAKPNAMTAASPTLPFGTKAKVTDLTTGKSVKVTVTDRGPYAKHRILDVSPKAARKLGMKHRGVAKVRVKPLHVPRDSR